MPFLEEEELVIAVAAQPFPGGNAGQALHQQPLDLGNRTGRSQVDSAEPAGPSEQVQMGIDEAGKNGLSATRESLRTRRDKRVHLPLCSDRQDLAGRNRHCFGDRTGWIEGEDAPPVEQKVSGGGE